MTSSSQSESSDELSNASETNLSSDSEPSVGPISMSVHRSDIEVAKVKEGVDELSGLNVEAYDQQIYEEEVFGQVDKALEEKNKKSPDQKNRSLNKTTDFIRVINDDKTANKDANSMPTVEQDDEEILKLTRLEAKKISTRLPQLIELVSGEDEDTEGEDEDFKYETESESDDSYVSGNKEILEIEEVEEDLKISDRSMKKKKLRDDGDLFYYKKRMKEYSHEQAKLKHANILDDGTVMKDLDASIAIVGDLKIHESVWNNLFDHQKTGVKWLWELHQLGTGGILGDEMGLGKTIQMIAFLVGLKISNMVDRHTRFEGLGPTVLVCPATVMHQWLMEFRTWWQPFRVAILHSTGTFVGKKKNLVEAIHRSKGILIVSFQGAVIYQEVLHSFDWHYAILDEGHKIRNPDAQITLACKRFRTPHRIILSGSPVQNNLKELWSIFDFIYPGKLGTLPVFMDQFSKPITQGGYANASDLQLQIAYKCACILRDTIKPFLLRRSKAEINHKLKLPEKSEQVLFCKLTDKQRNLYKAFLNSPTIREIRMGRCQIFVGLIYLRKICNHPDLFDATECESQYKGHEKKLRLASKEESEPNQTFGHYTKSGKMMVVDVLLKLWKKQGHKVLLFTQSRQMLKIIIQYLSELNYTYLYMDGSTSIGSRQTLIAQFNNDQEKFIFLLTTRVGGVGINLVGANRIIIFDPDWNPSTDIQARERAWRIGQQREVIIYRLITAGTIEEKIYHRQVFKLYLTNRILRDAKQKRFFKTNDLHELFTLGDDGSNIETKTLFEDDLQINPENIKPDTAARKRKRHEKKKKKKKSKDKKTKKEKHININRNDDSDVDAEIELKLSEEELQAMRQRARAISKMIEQKFSNQATVPAGEGGDNSSAPPSASIQLAQSSIKSVLKSRPTMTHVEHLVKQTVYKPPSAGEEQVNDDDGDKKQDNYVLKRLFKKSNIFGALRHDRIESDSTSDYKIVEHEADKIAREAIRSLRESRRLCLSSMTGVPNWTGRNGSMASDECDAKSKRKRLLPKNKSRQINEGGSVQRAKDLDGDGCLSKSSLIAVIRKRAHLNPTAASSAVDGDDNAELRVAHEFVGIADGTGAEQVAVQLHQYLMFEAPQRCEAETEQVLDFFKRKFGPSKTAVFKAILHKMCEFERRNKIGFWTLRSEFRL